jgi:hypothetical protein
MVLMDRNLRKVLVPRDELKPLIQSPSVYDLVDYMHISSCSVIIDEWDQDWLFCPVCGSRANDMGFVTHKNRLDEQCLT